MAIKIFYLIGTIFLLLIFLMIISAVFFFFVIPPKAVSISPSSQSLNVPPDSSIIIKFDKPIKRQEIKHTTIPEVYGEWKFEDPLIKNHFFKTLVFVPGVKLRPDTKYYIKIDNITAPISTGLDSRVFFIFKTKPADIKPATTNSPVAFTPDVKGAEEVISNLIKVPFDWQDHPLSCEAASLKMGLAAKGVNVSENDIMKKIGYDKTAHTGNKWGNPYLAFVGDINGSMCNTGYGVYWEPVAKAANYWRPAQYFSGWTLNQLVDELKLGNPVVVWGILPTGYLTDCSWYTLKGEYIKAYKEGHVRLAVGFMGSSKNPEKIIIKDPLSGDLYWSVSKFLTNWKIYDNSGVVIR